MHPPTAHRRAGTARSGSNKFLLVQSQRGLPGDDKSIKAENYREDKFVWQDLTVDKRDESVTLTRSINVISLQIKVEMKLGFFNKIKPNKARCQSCERYIDIHSSLEVAEDEFR